jgi:hypothetical protein
MRKLPHAIQVHKDKLANRDAYRELISLYRTVLLEHFCRGVAVDKVPVS